ncbi:MAG: hypothetical protein ACOZDY_16230 [Pseudomonadota bacterium]
MLAPIRFSLPILLVLGSALPAAAEPSRDAVQRELQRRELQQQQTQQRINQGVDVRDAGTPAARQQDQLRLEQDLRLQQLKQRQQRALIERQQAGSESGGALPPRTLGSAASAWSWSSATGASSRPPRRPRAGRN